MLTIVAKADRWPHHSKPSVLAKHREHAMKWATHLDALMTGPFRDIGLLMQQAALAGDFAEMQRCAPVLADLGHARQHLTQMVECRAYPWDRRYTQWTGYGVRYADRDEAALEKLRADLGAAFDEHVRPSWKPNDGIAAPEWDYNGWLFALNAVSNMELAKTVDDARRMYVAAGSAYMRFSTSAAGNP